MAKKCKYHSVDMWGKTICSHPDNMNGSCLYSWMDDCLNSELKDNDKGVKA
jgi:hypothetical protein